MARPHGTDATGRPLDLIGHRLDARPAPTVGVTILRREEIDQMTKAEQDGVYTLNGGRFKIRAGDVLPEGAEMEDPEERATGPAPENKSKAPAPENRAKGGEK